MRQSEILSYIPAEKVHSYAMDSKTTKQTLEKLGIGYTMEAFADIKQYSHKYGMDAAIPMVTTPGVSSPAQVLQHWIAEAIEVVTAAREIDSIVGRTIAGNWADKEIVQRVLERTGRPRPYGDDTDIPLSSWNANYECRDIVRFEEGCMVGILEQERAGRMMISAETEKRVAAAEALAIEMNNVGFYGYNSGNNRTYGFLNDPNLPAYVTVAEGAKSDTKWSTKSYDEICTDIRTAMNTLRANTGNLFRPERDAAVLSVSISCMEFLSVQNDMGTRSVYEWVKSMYPNVRIESAVQLDGANGGENIFVVHAEQLNGKRVMDQYIQEVFRLLGVEKKAKGFLEDYSNATAGIIVRQPVGVVRYTGI